MGWPQPLQRPAGRGVSLLHELQIAYCSLMLAMIRPHPQQTVAPQLRLSQFLQVLVVHILDLLKLAIILADKTVLPALMNRKEKLKLELGC